MTTLIDLSAVRASAPRTADPFAAVDWPRAEADLDARGWARLGPVLSPDDCAALIESYDDPALFRSRVVMESHAYGRGEYQYVAAPVPEPVASLRRAAYRRLAPIANRWREALGEVDRFPPEHDAFARACHEAGQVKPTPLILKYGPGDHNRLHRDRYGAVFFPIQMAVLLSQPGAGFEGGEFLLAETRMRQQIRVDIAPLGQGDAVIFAGDERPAAGARGPVKARLRHGVAEVRAGRRFTLGLIMHDAE